MNATQSTPQNIYQIYEANGNKTGFFVRRDSWKSIYAQVKTIAGQVEGPLLGKPPYFGNPPVIMDVFNNDGTVQGTNQQLTSPGTYAYKRIQPKQRRS